MQIYDKYLVWPAVPRAGDGICYERKNKKRFLISFPFCHQKIHTFLTTFRNVHGGIKNESSFVSNRAQLANQVKMRLLHVL